MFSPPRSRCSKSPLFKNLCVKQNRTVSCRSRFPRIVLSFSAVCIKQVLTRKSHLFKFCCSHNWFRVNHLTASYSVGMPITLSISSASLIFLLSIELALWYPLGNTQSVCLNVLQRLSFYPHPVYFYSIYKCYCVEISTPFLRHKQIYPLLNMLF